MTCILPTEFIDGPTTVDVPSEKCAVLDHSNSVMISWGMDMCASTLISLRICVGRSLVIGWSPIQGSFHMCENDPQFRKLIPKRKQDSESNSQKEKLYVPYDSQNYFPMHYSPIGVYNGDITCWLRGTNWIRKCYLDWHQASKAVTTYWTWGEPHLAVIDLTCHEMLLQASVSKDTGWDL
jgi:hypothetical protein